MLLRGKYNEATVFTDNIDVTAVGQIIELCNQKVFAGSDIRIMPDVHAGKGCVIGLVMSNVKDRVVPNLVGVDIGCGVTVGKLGTNKIDFDQLDSVIRHNVPNGNQVHSKERFVFKKLEDLHCFKHINVDRARKSVGSLGGGNHFIEVAKDGDDHFLLIHSGSRYLGKQVAEYYQQLAVESCRAHNGELEAVINELKTAGRQQEIEKAVKAIKQGNRITKGLEHLSGQLAADYMHDLRIAQEYAALNRQSIAKIISVGMRFDWTPVCDTIHNYVDENNTLRKGAVAAEAGQYLVVPMNMRDGTLLCTGKSNETWLNSAPHGAGRLMSRGQAKEMVSLDEFKASMTDVWSTSVKQETIDESPMAYKPMDEIIGSIAGETVEIKKVLKPAYNFKAN